MSPKRSPPVAHGGSLLWCLAQQLLARRLRPPAQKILAQRLSTPPRLARRLRRSAAGGFPLSITALGRGRYLHLLAGGYTAPRLAQLLRARRRLLPAPQLFARLLQRRARPGMLHAQLLARRLLGRAPRSAALRSAAAAAGTAAPRSVAAARRPAAGLHRSSLARLQRRAPPCSA